MKKHINKRRDEIINIETSKKYVKKQINKQRNEITNKERNQKMNKKTYMNIQKKKK